MSNPAPVNPRLLSTLAWTRSHVLAAIEGVDEPTLARSHVASGWTPLSMIRHLTLDVERVWFAGAMAGDQQVINDVEAGVNGFHDQQQLSPDKIIAGYRSACEQSDKIIAGFGADTPTKWQPYPEAPTDLTGVIAHVVAETACHAGHLDIVRENLDGGQFLVVDG